MGFELALLALVACGCALGIPIGYFIRDTQIRIENWLLQKMEESR